MGSLPSERSSENSSSDRRKTLALYAPQSPRSDVTTSTAGPPGVLASDQQRVVQRAGAREFGEHVGDLAVVGPSRLDSGLRLGDTRGRDQLLGLGDLLDRPGGADAAAQFAQCGSHLFCRPYFFFGFGLRTFTDSFSTSSSSIASTCSSGTTELPSVVSKPFLNSFTTVFEVVFQLLGELLALADLFEDLLVRALHVLEELPLELLNVLNGHGVEVAPGAQEDGDDLLLDRHRAVLRLLEQLDQPAAAVQLRLRCFVEVGGEGREGLEFAVLRQVEPQRARDLFHRLDLGRAADARHRHTDVDRRAHTLVEQVGLQEALAVGDRDDVGRDVGRDVVGLGLDDRQTGQRAAPKFVVQLGAAFEQARVQVEDVAGERLAARRAAQQQRDGAVGLGVLGQVVEHDQHVLAFIHPVLGNGRTGVWRKPFESRGVRCRRGDDRGVVHRAAIFQGLLHTGDGGALLADRDVHATDLLLGVVSLPVLPLVEDRVDTHRGLAGLAVTDDQLSLAAADRASASRLP